jgi:nicotinate-nucleotide adenylyltransferase
MIIAEHMLSACEVDEVWMVISPQNPFKIDIELSDEATRLELMRKSLNGHEQIKPCTKEFQLTKPSYTINTLEALSADHPDDEFILIMGSDNLLGIAGWKDFEKILENYKVFVYPRYRHEVSPEFMTSLDGDISLVEAPIIALSATEIRRKVKAGMPYRMLVRESVWRYIEREGLFL